jgi:hydrogenase expression/formation protein HypC
MCLAIPGKIIKISKDKVAEVDFGGVIRSVQMELLPDAKKGEFVIVHAGFAIQKLQEKDALETLQVLKDAFGEEGCRL